MQLQRLLVLVLVLVLVLLLAMPVPRMAPPYPEMLQLALPPLLPPLPLLLPLPLPLLLPRALPPPQLPPLRRQRCRWAQGLQLPGGPQPRPAAPALCLPDWGCR